jgi:hypothetical protein
MFAENYITRKFQGIVYRKENKNMFSGRGGGKIQVREMEKK